MEDMKDYILKYFTYHKDGTITRNDRKNGFGSYDKDGYLIIKVKGKQYKAHRIAWLLNYKEFPTQELDHINRKRTDNRIENLRLSNRKQQAKNITVSKNKYTGYQGIGIDRTKGLKKKYVVKLKEKTYRFYTINDAIKFRKERGYEI